ncbi:MAG: hypothetical protein AAGH92_01135, partial [Planctomycetota bacterium]
RRLLREFGDTPQALRDLSVSLNNIGDVTLAERGPAAALPLYEESLEVRRRLLHEFGDTPQALRDLSVSLERVGDVQASAEQSDPAAEGFGEALATYRRLIEEFGGEAEDRWRVRVPLFRLAVLAGEAGDAAKGLGYLREALEHVEAVRERWGALPEVERSREAIRNLISQIES